MGKRLIHTTNLCILDSPSVNQLAVSVSNEHAKLRHRYGDLYRCFANKYLPQLFANIFMEVRSSPKMHVVELCSYHLQNKV